jgi:hypothetical protein
MMRLIYQFKESVIEEKLSMTGENESVTQRDNEKLSENREFESVLIKSSKVNINNAMEMESKFNSHLARLKAHEVEIKNDLFQLTSDKIADVSKQYAKHFKAYEMDLNARFESIVNCEYLVDLKPIDYLNLELIESNRLRLRRKVTSKSSEVINKKEEEEENASIRKKTDNLKQECLLLERIYKEQKKNAIDKCELLASNLNDCYVLFNK